MWITFSESFEYRKAVEFMANPTTDNGLSIGIVDELLQRGALEKSLSELGEELCLGVLTWLMHAFGTGDGLQQQMLMETLHTLLDGNKCLQPPSSPKLVDVITKIESKINAELRIQEVLMETAGMLKTVTAS